MWHLWRKQKAATSHEGQVVRPRRTGLDELTYRQTKRFDLHGAWDSVLDGAWDSVLHDAWDSVLHDAWDSVREHMLSTTIARRSVFVGFASIGSLLTLVSQPDLGAFGNLLLTLAVFLVAYVTLEYAIPTPGELLIVRQDEVPGFDLRFDAYPVYGHGEVPRLIQLDVRVAVVNVGGRKAVLSALDLIDFCNDQGMGGPGWNPFLRRTLPGESMRRSATRSVDMATGAFGPTSVIETYSTLPLVLGSDEVAPLAFRLNMDITWDHTWIQAMVTNTVYFLRAPLTDAVLKMTYRRGHRLIEQVVLVPIKVRGQTEFHDRLQALTNGQTTWPNIPQQPPAMTFSREIDVTP